MDEQPIGVFVLTMTAVAGPRNAEPDGRRYDLLVFARADDEAQAEQVAFAGLDARGWIEGRAVRCGEIVDAGAVPQDLRGTVQRALEGGCALIVYDQP